MRRVMGCIIIWTVLSTPLNGQQVSSYSISGIGTFTTSSKLFRNANATDELLQSSFLPLNSIFSIGIDLRRSIEPIPLQIGISIEYFSASETYTLTSLTTSDNVPVLDGFYAIPVEISGYFPIPIGTSSIQVYMGGGGGIYFGNRRYEYGGTPAAVVGRNVGFGIHILSGVDIALSRMFSLRTEIKFRDIQLKTTNRFTSFSTLVNGHLIPLDQDPLVSRINIDGMTLNFGFAYHF